MRFKEWELRSLNQVISVVIYLTDFSCIKGFVKWNDEALASQFYKGLKSVVKDDLVYKNFALTTLVQLSAAAIQINSRQYKRLLKRKLESSAPSQSLRTPWHHSADPSLPPLWLSITVTPSVAPRLAPTPMPTSDDSTPMKLNLVQLYRSYLYGPLSDVEKRRWWKLNLCL